MAARVRSAACRRAGHIIANNMLSKVLSRANAGSVQPVVFPQLSGCERDFEKRNRIDQSGIPDDTTDNAELQVKLHQLESQIATERQNSFESGRLHGEQQARAEIRPVIERLNASVTEVLSMRSDLRRRAEQDVVRLALLIAKRVLHRQLSVDETALVGIARVVFERLTRSESYRVTVHPQFAPAVASALPGNHAAHVQIEPDPDCAPGTLIIHSSEGTIDASVDAQLEEINRGLTDRLNK
jgi:flagellar assembly protein FliH